jgi:hypothetical protein
MRKKIEIQKEESITCDKVWYQRHQCIKDKIKKDGTPKDIVKGAFKAAKEMEKEYGKKNLKLVDDFEWGVLNGRLETLRWVLGEDWDMLDT